MTTVSGLKRYPSFAVLFSSLKGANSKYLGEKQVASSRFTKWRASSSETIVEKKKLTPQHHVLVCKPRRARAPSGHARGVSGAQAPKEETRASSVSLADAVRRTRKERNQGTSVIITQLVSANSAFWCGDCQGVPREAQDDFIFLLRLDHQVQDRTNERKVRQQSES